MTTTTKTGWKRVLLLGALAGLSVFVLLAIAGVATLLWATSVADDLGEPTPVRVARTVAVVAQAAQSAPTGPTASVPPRAAVRLDIELQDGKFEIVAGPPGTDVRVEGVYAENYYELTEESSTNVSGGRSTSIRLRPTRALSVRMVAALRVVGGGAPSPNELTVAIPAGQPIALTLRISQAESRIDLGGLTLTELDVDLSMGNHRLGFGEPLAREIELVRVDGRVGNVELDHLGNARAREFRASSSMGNFSADLGGAWRPEDVAKLSFDHSMGELFLRIPNTVTIAEDSRNSVRHGEGSRIRGDASPGPVLRLNLSTTLGGARITRYDSEL